MDNHYSKVTAAPDCDALTRVRAALLSEGLVICSETDAAEMLPPSPHRTPEASVMIWSLSYAAPAMVGDIPAQEQGPAASVDFNIVIRSDTAHMRITGVDPAVLIRDTQDFVLRRQAMLAGVALQAALGSLEGWTDERAAV